MRGPSKTAETAFLIFAVILVALFATWLADTNFHWPYKPGDMDSIYEDQ